MGSTRGLSLGLLVGALTLFVSGCVAVRQAKLTPTARVESVELTQVAPDAATVTFTIDARNPYSTSLPLVGLDFALSVKERKFLEGTADLDQQIPARSHGTVTVPVHVPFVELYKVASEVEFGRTIPYRADLGLRVTAPILGPLSLPLEANGEIRLPSS